MKTINNKYKIIDIDKEWEHISKFIDNTDVMKTLEQVVTKNDNNLSISHLPENEIEWSFKKAIKGLNPAPWKYTNSDYYSIKAQKLIPKSNNNEDTNALFFKSISSVYPFLDEELLDISVDELNNHQLKAGGLE